MRNELSKQRHGQQSLDRPRPVCFGKESAVQKGRAAQPRAPLPIPGEQFLRDGVAVVVGENMHRPAFVLGEQRLAVIGLQLYGVVRPAWLLRQPEAEHVERVQRIPLGEARSAACDPWVGRAWGEGRGRSGGEGLGGGGTGGAPAGRGGGGGDPRAGPATPTPARPRRPRPPRSPAPRKTSCTTSSDAQ